MDGPRPKLASKLARRWPVYVLALAAVAVAALAISQIGPPASSARTTTQLVSAENGVVQSTVTGTGNVEAGTDEDVNFNTSGTLAGVDVAFGQHVNKGQLLATLDSSSAQLTLDAAQESLTAAQDNLTSAQDGTSSSAGGSGSADTTTTSAESIESAQASVDGAEATVDNDETALVETRLYAPVSGTIVSLQTTSPGASISAGATSNAAGSDSSSSSSSSASSGSSASTSSSSSSNSGSAFAEIVNTNAMTMTVALSESDIGKLKVGQPATVTIDALTGVELAAHVSSISTVGSSDSGVVSYNATLTLDQTDPSVKPGMSASASVVVDQAQGVTVPTDAIAGAGSTGTVDVESDGKTAQKQVVVGLRGSSRTQIVSGISAGTQLVVTTMIPSLGSSSSAASGSRSASGTLGGSGLAGGASRR